MILRFYFSGVCSVVDREVCQIYKLYVKLGIYLLMNLMVIFESRKNIYFLRILVFVLHTPLGKNAQKPRVSNHSGQEVTLSDTV